MKEQLSKNDYEKWKRFKGFTGNQITSTDLRLIEYLHSKYFNHPLETLCTCRGEKIVGKVQAWVDDINKIYENGYNDNT